MSPSWCRSRVLGLAVATLCAVGVAACGGSASTSSTAPGSSTAAAKQPRKKITKIAIATPEKATDFGWNSQGVAAAKAVAKRFHAKLTIDDGIGYDNTQAVLQRLAQEGNQLIFAHASGYGPVGLRVAQQYNVPVVVDDAPNATVPGRSANISNSAQDGSYLAGVVAAKMTKTGTLGVAISASSIAWYRDTGGFIAGARSVNKNITIRFVQIGPAGYEDAAGAKRVTETLIAANADIIYGMGDGASFGYLQAIQTANVGHKVWFIDVIGNKSSIDTKHVLLTSVLWNYTPIFTRAFQDVENGTFGAHAYTLDLDTGVSLLKTPYIPAKIWASIVKVKAQILAGKIKVPATTTAGAVTALLAK